MQRAILVSSFVEYTPPMCQDLKASEYMLGKKNESVTSRISASVKHYEHRSFDGDEGRLPGAFHHKSIPVAADATMFKMLAEENLYWIQVMRIMKLLLFT